MTKNDLRNFTHEELKELFVDLVNTMEEKASDSMQKYNESENKQDNIEKYAYASGLLTQVNRIKTIVLFKNSGEEFRKEIDEEISEQIEKKIINDTNNSRKRK